MNSELIYNVDGYHFQIPVSNVGKYLLDANLKGVSKLKFKARVLLEEKRARAMIRRAIQKKECCLGPFKGEFGHFLAHVLPFVMYLHKKGVKIHYLGMGLHKPFMVDEEGETLVHQYYSLRDFFTEIAPNCNSTIPPDDVMKEINRVEQLFERKNVPYIDIDGEFYYWFVHRHLILEDSHTHVYDLSKLFAGGKQNSCAIFTRNKGGEGSLNNGGAWDYDAIIDDLLKVFDKVYVCGHPRQSLRITEREGVEHRVSFDNSVILEAASKSKLLITQHSGVCYLGNYTSSDVLVIYNGGDKIEDIGSMNNTLHFRKGIKGNSSLNFAFSRSEICERIEIYK